MHASLLKANAKTKRPQLDVSMINYVKTCCAKTRLREVGYIPHRMQQLSLSTRHAMCPHVHEARAADNFLLDGLAY